MIALTHLPRPIFFLVHVWRLFEKREGNGAEDCSFRGFVAFRNRGQPSELRQQASVLVLAAGHTWLLQFFIPGIGESCAAISDVELLPDIFKLHIFSWHCSLTDYSRDLENKFMVATDSSNRYDCQ